MNSYWRGWNQPVFCKLVNRCMTPATIPCGNIAARMIVVNARDTERLARTLNPGPSSSDDPSLLPVSSRSGRDAVDPSHDLDASVERWRLEDANCGHLDKKQKQEPIILLDEFIGKGPFPADPKRVVAFLDGELSLPKVDESDSAVAKKQRRSSPEETLGAEWD